jgi:hypothetical protein
MGRSHYPCAYREETLYQFHGLDVRHRRENVASEALPWLALLPTPWERFKRLGDTSLEHSRRALQCQLEPGLRLSKTLYGGRHDGGLGEPDFGDRSAEDRALEFSKAQEHPSDGESLVGGAPGCEPEDFAKIGLLAIVGGAIGPADLSPVPVAMNLPG